MKHNKTTLLFCLAIIFCLLNESIAVSLRFQEAKKSSKKANKNSQKTNSNSNANVSPVNLQQALKATVYSQVQQEPSEVEQNPNGYKHLGPFTKEQEDKLFPKQVYLKDPNTYNLNEATPQNIGDSKVLLVNNMTAAKEQFKDHKFFDEKQRLDPIAQSLLSDQQSQPSEPRFPVKQNDQQAYYNPITEKNIYRPQDNGLYVVPINLQQQSQESDEVKQQIDRQRLARKGNYYYDASALYELPTIDPLQKRLQEQAKLNALPKPVKLNEWIKQEEQKKERLNTALGQQVEEARPARNNIVKNLDIQKTRAVAEANPLPPVKNNEQAPYYDATKK